MTETKGILGTKLGMTQIFDDTRAVPVTVIKAGPCVVSQIKTKETDGYDAVQLAFGTVRPRDLNSPMKRHGFHGLKASHGTEKKHRAPGAIGACATPSRVFKDMPMAGQYGNVRVTVLNLEVVQADAERGLLLVRGAVPGANGGLVMARSAVKALTGLAAGGGGGGV